jgi:hypothetical protein
MRYRLRRCHAIIALAESGGGFQSLVVGNVDGAERFENFRLQSRQSPSPLLMGVSAQLTICF